MAVKIKQLIDDDGTSIVPIGMTFATFDTEGNSVEKKFEDQEYAISEKADKVGYEPLLRVGVSDTTDNITPSNGNPETAYYDYRSAGGTADLATGISTVNNIDGRSVRQILKNGNFAEGGNTPTGWTISAGATVNNSNNEYIIISGNSGEQISKSAGCIAGHKYVCIQRVKAVSGTWRYGHNISVLTTSSTTWITLCQIFTMSGSDNAIRFASQSSSAVLYIDKGFGVCLYDLTELGLESLITDQGTALALLGEQYNEGVVGANILQKQDTSFNQFNVADVIEGYGINTSTGALTAKADKCIIFFHAIASEVGTGKNNGYRLHTTGNSQVITAVGWNPFIPTVTEVTRFDKVYNVQTVASGTDVDYSSNISNGYIIAECVKGEQTSLICHLRWSYEAYDDQYANESLYQLFTLDMPYGTHHGIGTAVDSTNLVQSRHTRKISSINAEDLTWGYSVLEDLNPYFYAVLPGKRANVTLGNRSQLLTNDYTAVNACAYGDQKIDKTIMESSSDNTQIYICDLDYSNVDDFVSAINGMKIYFELASPIIETISVGSNAVNINDFGTEQLIYEGTIPQIVAEYYDNYKDYIRHIPEEFSIAAAALVDLNERLTGIENLVNNGFENITVKNLKITRSITANVKIVDSNGNLEGSGAPNFAPLFKFQEYLDTSSNKFYKAKGISTAADWIALN